MDISREGICEISVPSLNLALKLLYEVLKHLGKFLFGLQHTQVLEMLNLCLNENMFSPLESKLLYPKHTKS